MFTVTNSTFISFAHHVRGHAGPCISLHGHTWKFELTLASETLDAEGFVLDFGEVRRRVLVPAHDLLDHSLAMGEKTWERTGSDLAKVGEELVNTRMETLGNLGTRQKAYEGDLNGARNAFPGGIKVTIFPFSPTSERLAQWLYELAKTTLEDDRVRVVCARVTENLHPTESVAEYRPS